MVDITTLDKLAQAAAPVMHLWTGTPVNLVQSTLLKSETRSLVIRCRMTPTQDALSSVIIKQIRDNATLGFSEWASLAFLSDLPEARGLTPHFYGGDVSARFFVMEDMGSLRCIQDVLMESDGDAARVTLRNMARQMARLHNATRGREAVYAALRKSLPAAPETARTVEASQWLQQSTRLHHWFDALGCAPPNDFEQCLHQIANTYAHPGPFLSFSHGDPAPTNNHVADGRVRLLDFEYGGFRHALYDISAWNVLCPLPIPVVQEMVHVFRDELANEFTEAHDDVLFTHAWATLCAYRALAMLTWIGPDVLVENRPWVGDWSARAAIFAALSRLYAVTADVADLAPIAAAAHALAQRLRREWPEWAHIADLAIRWPALDR